MVFEPESIARLKKKRKPVTPIEPPKEELPEFEPETIARRRAELPQLELPELFKRVYPEFEFETEQGQVVLQTMLQWAEEDPTSFLQDIYAKGKTPETEALLQAFGAEETEVEEFFAPIPTTPVEELITDIFPEKGIEEFATQLETDFGSFIEEMQLGGRTKEKQDLLRWMGMEWEEINEIFKTQKVVMDIEGVRKLVTIMPDNAVLDEQGRHIGTVNPATLEFEPYKYRIGDTWKSFSAGTGDVIVTSGGALKWLGADGIGERLSEFGSYLQLQAPPDTLGEFDWQMLYNPRFYSERVTRTVPFTLALIPAWIAGATAGGAVAGVFAVGRFGTFLLKALGAAALSRPIESALEAGGTYDEAIDKGMSVAEAKEAASEVFINNLALVGVDAAQLAVAFAPTPARVFSGLISKGLVTTARIGGKVTITGLSEAGEEYYQEIIQRQALGEEIVWDAEMKEVTAIGGIMGLGLGVGGDVFATIQKKTRDALSPERKDLPLDELIADPEVQQIVEDVIENVKIDELEKEIKPQTEVDKIVWEHTFEQMREEAPAVPVIPGVIEEIKIGYGHPLYQTLLRDTISRAELEGRRGFWQRQADEWKKEVEKAEPQYRETAQRQLEIYKENVREADKLLTKPPVTPPVVKEPEIPEVIGEGGIPVPPEEPIPQGVIDNNPLIHDIGAKEGFRPSRNVYNRMGLYTTYRGIQEAEVLVGEAKIATQKRVKELFKPIDKARRELVFDEANNKGSVVGLTVPEKRAVTFIREFYNEWADKKNLPKEKRIKDYITHLFEQEMTAELKETGKISPELARILSEKVPKKITDPFLKERLGAVGFQRDPVAAIMAYDAVANRVLYYEPMLQKIAAIANDPAQPEAARDYLRDYSRRMTGEPSKFDRKINADLQEIAGKLRGLPGGKAVAQFLDRGNPAGMVAYQMAGAYYLLWLGYKATSAIRNLSQHTLIMAEVGPVGFTEGFALEFTEEGRQVLREALGKRGRKAAFVPGVDDSFAVRWTDTFREQALWLFRKADALNVNTATLAGYAEAKKILTKANDALPLDKQLPKEELRQLMIDRGDEVQADTQYLYTKMSSMAWSQNAPGRVLSVLTTWAENWIELMIKWVSRRPSQVYLEFEKRTGAKVAGANWATSYKAILTYMAIIALGYVIKERERLKAWEYTGLTSIRYLANVLGGDFPGLEMTGAISKLVAGFVADDDRMFKEGWNQTKSIFTPGIVKQILAVASGDKDWLTLLFYLEGRDWKLKKLKDKWKKDFEPYNELAQKDREEYRENNPKIEAKLFITSQFTTLSTDEARAEVLRLIEEHDLDTEMIDGYEKVFGVDTAVELDKFQNRVGNLEKLEVGVEAEYYTMNDFASEVNTLVKNMGRTKVEQDGNQLAVEYLRAKDLFVQYDSLEEADARKQYRLQFPDVEASLYLWGRISAFLNPNSAVELLRLMKKYDIPPEGIKAFVDDPAKYDALQAPLFQLQLEWNDMLIEYELAEKEERELMLEENPAFRDARRQIEAINKGVPENLVMPYVEYYAMDIAGWEQERFLRDNEDYYKEVWLGILENEEKDFEKIPSIEFEKATNEYEALRETADREAYLEQYAWFRIERREKEAIEKEIPEKLQSEYVEYYEIPSIGYANERYLMEHQELYRYMVDSGEWFEKDFSKVPTEKFEEALVGYEELELGYDRYEFRGNNPWFDQEGVRIGRWDAFDPELFIPRNIVALLEEYDVLPTTGKTRLIYRHNHPELEKWFVKEKGYVPVGDRWKGEVGAPRPKKPKEKEEWEKDIAEMEEKLKKLRG